MKIQVTKEHIKEGKQQEPRYCAVALALKEKLGSNFDVKVLAEDFIITNKENLIKIKNHIVSTNKRQMVINFISDFDSISEYQRLNELEPIEFELKIKGIK